MKTINGIGLIVKDLDKSAAFYKDLGFDNIQPLEIEADSLLDNITGSSCSHKGRIIFQSGARLELFQSPVLSNDQKNHMPYEAGIRHICAMSPPSDPLFYTKLLRGQYEVLTREPPAELSGSDYYYVYGWDPEGNLIELEQPKKPGLNSVLKFGHVSLATHDIRQLVTFYGALLRGEGEAADRENHIKDQPGLDNIIDNDGAENRMAWFHTPILMLEIVEYIYPKTEKCIKAEPVALGYSHFHITTTELEADHAFLASQNLPKLTEIMEDKGKRYLIASDPDGNYFTLTENTEETT
ncbi:MAG: VOC family protein [Bacteroidetes bacterium]|nr:VOC family protein [Bacteroidota bacterium]